MQSTPESEPELESVIEPIVESESRKPRTSPMVVVMRVLALVYFSLIACVIAYIWVVAQDRFISVASFKISRQAPSAPDLGFAQLALPGLADSGSVDSQIAIGFVNSTDLLLQLEGDFGLAKHYSAPASDWVFRLGDDAPLEERIGYYRKRIYAHFDKETGMTMLTVDTFSPKLSRDIAEAVLKRAEMFINTLNQVVADQQLEFINGEVERTEKQVGDVNVEILKLQNTYNMVTPDEQISADLKAVQELRMERMKIETTLATIGRDSPDSPRVEILRSQLRSLDEQIAVESSKISGPEQHRLNQILVRYKELERQLEFAIKLRTSAETLLEKHRVDAVARSRFLSVIQHPFTPEDVGYPRRWYASVAILALGALLFLILRALVHSVYERV